MSSDRVLRVLALLLGLVLIAGPAAAHGDAWWIGIQPYYLDRLGSHCCGPSDCEPVNSTVTIVEQSDGIVVNGYLLSNRERGIYWSKDDRWWVCIEVLTRRPKCVFKPHLRM